MTELELIHTLRTETPNTGIDWTVTRDHPEVEGHCWYLRGKLRAGERELVWGDTVELACKEEDVVTVVHCALLAFLRGMKRELEKVDSA